MYPEVSDVTIQRCNGVENFDKTYQPFKCLLLVLCLVAKKLLVLIDAIVEWAQAISRESKGIELITYNN